MIEKFTIDRSKWLHGEGGENSKLLRARDQKMCCLGFLAKACGLEDDDIVETAYPSAVPTDKLGNLPEWLFGDLTEDGSLFCSFNTTELMTTNDKYGIEDEDREQVIKDIFKSYGIEVTFEGSYE